MNGLREGQRAYNQLREKRPDLATRILGTELDPFYIDSRLPAFREWLVDELIAESSDDGHDWFTEARGLAWMILNIHKQWDDWGDGELFRSALYEAHKYVDGPLRDVVNHEMDGADK